MSYWLISVPTATSGTPVPQALASASNGQTLSQSVFDIPQLKVGTLDQLMQLSEDTTKMDVYVGGVAKKIEKTYLELWRNEAVEAATLKAASASGGSSDKKGGEEKAPELRIGEDNKSASEFVTNWHWNDVRYPRRSPLRLLADLISKDASKSDEALRRQVTEFNEVRSAYSTIDRRDAGSLLVKPLGQYVTKAPTESEHLTTLFIVVARAREQEFNDCYESMEGVAAAKEEEETKKKQLEADERSRKEAIRVREEAAAAASSSSSTVPAAAAARTPAQIAHDALKAAEKAAALVAAAEAKQVEAELSGAGSGADPAQRAKQLADKKEKDDEEEKKRNKKLPKGCNAVVPRSAILLSNEPSDEYLLFSVVVLRAGAEGYKHLLREKRFVVRPFKFDPDEDQKERERKTVLGIKKKQLWNFLIRWCTTTYAEVFAAWIHLKAIRLYVEGVLRYGLPYASTSLLLLPSPGREKVLRATLKTLYGNLAGANANLTTALDANETDISGLGADFYPYVYLPLSLVD